MRKKALVDFPRRLHVSVWRIMLVTSDDTRNLQFLIFKINCLFTWIYLCYLCRNKTCLKITCFWNFIKEVWIEFGKLSYVAKILLNSCILWQIFIKMDGKIIKSFILYLLIFNKLNGTFSTIAESKISNYVLF